MSTARIKPIRITRLHPLRDHRAPYDRGTSKNQLTQTLLAHFLPHHAAGNLPADPFRFGTARISDLIVRKLERRFGHAIEQEFVTEWSSPCEELPPNQGVHWEENPAGLIDRIVVFTGRRTYSLVGTSLFEAVDLLVLDDVLDTICLSNQTARNLHHVEIVIGPGQDWIAENAREIRLQMPNLFELGPGDRPVLIEQKVRALLATVRPRHERGETSPAPVPQPVIDPAA